ncbi:MAG: glucosamine-6-phosphate deaminase [Microcella sp.]
MAEVVILPNAEVAGALVADHILTATHDKPELVLGLATGSTPLTVYRALSEKRASLARARGFALDEYLGLPSEHPERYRAVINREVVEPLGLDPHAVHVPGDDIDHGDPAALAGAGAAFERELHEAGGIDIQLLGIGATGHIGFNEPGSSFASRTRVKTLTEQTRRDNARFFSSLDEVPMHCITQGLGTILEASHLVLLAFGPGKAAAIAAAVEGPVTASLPGSAIQLHPHCTVVVDEAAGAELSYADYYRYAWREKPRWQGL